MSTGYKIVDQEALRYFSGGVLGWFVLFTRQVYRDIVPIYMPTEKIPLMRVVR